MISIRKFAVSILFIMTILNISAYAKNKNVCGVYEKVTFLEFGDVEIKAKLDTGALTSSLGVSKLEYFMKNDELWVRFIPEIEGFDKTVENPIIRQSKIKKRIEVSGSSKVISERPVIILDICFDGKVYPIEVNLADRSNFIYPLLLGRKALKQFNILIDPSKMFLSSPECR